VKAVSSGVPVAVVQADPLLLGVDVHAAVAAHLPCTFVIVKYIYCTVHATVAAHLLYTFVIEN
jgi:hypothetical protein